MAKTSEIIDFYNSELFNYTELEEPGYPKRVSLPDSQIDWAVPLPAYELATPNFTADATVEAGREGLADPHNFNDVEKTFDGLTDDGGRPLMPLGRTGITGLGALWHWGESRTVDTVVTRDTNDLYQILAIGKFYKGRKPALPGGFIKKDQNETYEPNQEAAAREVEEETGIKIKEEDLQPIGKILTRSKRTTDNAWISTDGLWVNLTGRSALQIPEGGDDADVARWIDVTEAMLDSMSTHHAVLVKARFELDG